VLLLLGWLIRSAGRLGDWPAEFVDAFAGEEHRALWADCVRQAELAHVLGECDDAGIEPILFKGAALAHTHYPAPHIRVRADTDLLVAQSELATLDAVFGRLGYARAVETTGVLVSYQRHYHKTDRYGLTHAFDVHWKISNLQALANCFTHADLRNVRAPVAPLGPSAMTVDSPHALALALVHRAGHHPGSQNLLWLYDLNLLESRLTAVEAQRFQAIIAARGLNALAAEGLSTARAGSSASFGNPARPWTQAEVLRRDLQALPDWRTRGRLLREHLFPPSHYMRAKYGVRSNVTLPAWYIWRALHGMPKWLRRPAED
jgi:hypothetical protein